MYIRKACTITSTEYILWSRTRLTPLSYPHPVFCGKKDGVGKIMCKNLFLASQGCLHLH